MAEPVPPGRAGHRHLSHATPRERLRFFRDYIGGLDRRLLRKVRWQSDYLERRKPNLSATYRGTPHLA